jgi:hypothetical protein
MGFFFAPVISVDASRTVQRVLAVPFGGPVACSASIFYSLTLHGVRYSAGSRYSCFTSLGNG